MLRAPFPLHTCHRQYPGAAVAGTTLPFSRDDLSLPRIDWQVGPHITLFEACSAFTHVAACILAKSPSDPLHRRLQPLRYLHDCSGCFRREQNRRAGFAPAGKAPPFHGARRTRVLCTDQYHHYGPPRVKQWMRSDQVPMQYCANFDDSLGLEKLFHAPQSSAMSIV